MRRIGLLLFLALIALTLLQGCTCCVYFNHMFNAERAWEEGLTLQKARQDSLPTDTTWVTMDERAKFDRVIEKCSRTLERFPDDVDSKPRAVFLIAESFRKKGEWSKAIIKYDEFERYFADHDSMPAVEYQRAFCLYKNRDHAVARFALDRIFQKGDAHPYFVQSLQLLSLLEEQANMPELAIAALEKVLASGGGTAFMRGKMHLRLADLYFKQESWGKSREHYRVKEIDSLDVRDRIVAGTQGVECLAKMEKYAEALKELKGYIGDKNFETQMAEMLVRYGELQLLAGSFTDGLNTLLKVAKTYPKTNPAARSWYGMGDFEQSTRKNYKTAILHYDSSWACWPSSEWGRKSKVRRDALSDLIKLQEKRGPETVPGAKPKEDFQIAELFLFKLAEVDSAIRILDRIVASQADSNAINPDSTVLQRAHYARAFIFDEFKSDTLKADSLYRDIIQRFPGSTFAKQAQANLGLRVTVKTWEDQAHDAFLRAESLWFAIDSISADSIALIDSAFANCMRAYDSVSIRYPKTDYAAKALFAKAWIYENQQGQMDSAKVVYDQVRSNYGNTPWGMAAIEKFQPRLKITDQDLDRLRRRVQNNQESGDRLRKQYEEDMKKAQEADRKKKQAEPNVDEVLENDYNSLYDFQ